ncbi:hypothetical protein [Shewanella waksmanii]|uniref:cyanobactin maturation protease PatG family protein n=1 Tax=Shewanella waksmanii TaxID=213783 RepID=UPI0004AE099F|nr:hypothetical protein [Shewanella waksmanii]
MTTTTQSNPTGTRDVTASIAPQNCGGGEQTFVFAIGQFRPYFATLDLQHEFNAASQTIKATKGDYYAVFSHTISAPGESQLSVHPYAYLAEQACWVFTINDVDSYLMVPSSEIVLNAFISALNPSLAPSAVTLCGMLGPKAPASYCGNLNLPLVMTSNLLTLDQQQSELLPIKANSGISDADRAVNFLMTQLPSLSQQQSLNLTSLQSLSFQFSTAVDNRTVVEVILGFNQNGINNFYACGIDVSDQNPFLTFPLRTFVPAN